MDQLIDLVRNTFASNEFAQGGLILGVLSGFLFWMRTIPGRIKHYAVKFIMLSVTVDQHMKHFDQLDHFIGMKFKDAEGGEMLSVGGELVPSGTRWTRRGKNVIRTNFSRRELEFGGERTGAYSYSINISIFGSQRRACLAKLLSEAGEAYKLRFMREPAIYRNQSDYWQEVQKLRKREWQSIYSPFNEELIGDLERFRQAETDYEKTGMPYRRGYLFHGLPGTGKTSSARALASHFGYDLYVLDLSAPNLSSSGLMNLFSASNCLILIEDIDAQIQSVMDRDDKSSKLTLSSILNAIDGVASGHNIVLIVTSNRAEKLDDALVRPGRIDRAFEFEEMKQPEFNKACKNLFGKNGLVCPESITPSTVQQCYQLASGNYEKFETLVNNPPTLESSSLSEIFPDKHEQDSLSPVVVSRLMKSGY